MKEKLAESRRRGRCVGEEGSDNRIDSRAPANPGESRSTDTEGKPVGQIGEQTAAHSNPHLQGCGLRRGRTAPVTGSRDP